MFCVYKYGKGSHFANLQKIAKRAPRNFESSPSSERPIPTGSAFFLDRILSCFILLIPSKMVTYENSACLNKIRLAAGSYLSCDSAYSNDCLSAARNGAFAALGYCFDRSAFGHSFDMGFSVFPRPLPGRPGGH